MRDLFIIILLCLMTLTSCNNNSKKESSISLPTDAFSVEKKALEKKASTQILFDTTKIVAHWEGVKKELIGIDSLEAWEFVWEHCILENYKANYRDVLFVKMTKHQISNLYEQIFITINNERSYVYQRNNKKKWKKLWSGSKDEGDAPKLLTTSDNWIESTYYTPCSHCSHEGSRYYKIYEDSVIEFIQISTAFNLDHESSSDELLLYEQCNALVEFHKEEFRVTYDICFSEIESQTFFIQNHLVKVVYKIDENTNQMMIEEVFPKGLKPFILKWHKKGEEFYSCYGYQPNNEVLLAYFDYKKEYLIKLKAKEGMVDLIKQIETSYRTPWDSLMTNWNLDYSFAFFS